VGLVGASAALYHVTADVTFAVDPARIGVRGATYTGAARVRAAMDLPDGMLVNVFRIPTRAIEARLEQLPAVLRAEVVTTLPDQLSVTIQERTPILTWRVRSEAWLVDVDGTLFAPTSAAVAGSLGSGATGSALPELEDRRDRPRPSVGDRVDPLDLEVVRLLGSITPAMAGSTADELRLSIDDELGWVLEAPGAWRAVFGHYSPQLVPPSAIPRQLQCLAALLTGQEARVRLVRLSVSADACGTYVEGAQPRATERPSPSAPSADGRRDAAGRTEEGRRDAAGRTEEGRRDAAARTPRP
jgi:hypothetical protein